MIRLLTGSTHTGKTLLAQRLLERHGAPYLSIDHRPTYRRTRTKQRQGGTSFALCTCARFSWAEVSPPCCPFHPISLLLRKETGWSPKETRFWVPPRELFGPARLSHGLEAPTSQPTASS